MKSNAKRYRLGSFTVFMTPDQAHRWNKGEPNEEDSQLITVCVPDSHRDLPIHHEFTMDLAYERFPLIREFIDECYPVELV